MAGQKLVHDVFTLTTKRFKKGHGVTNPYGYIDLSWWDFLLSRAIIAGW